MAQGIKRCGNKLQPAKQELNRARGIFGEDPGKGQHQEERQGKAQERGAYDGGYRKQRALPNYGANACLGDAGAEQTANQRMRTA